MYSTTDTNEMHFMDLHADSRPVIEDKGFQSELEDELEDDLEDDHTDGVETNLKNDLNTQMKDQESDLEDESENLKTDSNQQVDDKKLTQGHELKNLKEEEFEDELENIEIEDDLEGSDLSESELGSATKPHDLESEEEGDDGIDQLDVSEDEIFVSNVAQISSVRSTNAKPDGEPYSAEGNETKVELQDSLMYVSSGQTNTLQQQHEDGTQEYVTISDSDNDSDSTSSSTEDIPVPIIITIMGSEFLLFPFNEGSDCPDMSHLVSLFEDDSIKTCSIEQLFMRLREQEELRELLFFDDAKEMCLKLPQLNMNITEDNVYSREVTLADFTLIFRKLCRNTSDTARPKSLKLDISTELRFITQFNDLAQRVRDGKGFEHAKRSLELHETDELNKRQKS